MLLCMRRHHQKIFYFDFIYDTNSDLSVMDQNNLLSEREIVHYDFTIKFKTTSIIYWQRESKYVINVLWITVQTFSSVH